MCFDETADSDPNVVRRRSPLLFSTILATATYYNCGAATTNESRRLYEDLILYVNLLIAPNIVSAIPHLMTIGALLWSHHFIRFDDEYELLTSFILPFALIRLHQVSFTFAALETGAV